MHVSNWKLLGLCLCWCLELGSTQNSSHVVWEPSGTTNKREVANRLDYAGTNIAKSYDPPPEFYRGPGTTVTSSGSSSSTVSGTSGLGSAQLGSVGESLSEAYNKWRQSAGQHDRISVGHYGGGAGQAAHIQTPHGHASYAYEGHPYEYAGVAAGHGGYYGGSSAESGIPFDVYGSRPVHGSHHQVHYPGPSAGGGSEYAYLESHELASHKGPPELSQKALLAKSFLIPLASAAVLGIAAALVSNPLLLQLGTVSGLGGGFVPAVGKPGQ
ncbi:uncharacterized protein LOC111599008 [Drosophila hydei]|uniref:Uncharacterized protein LOC111599008 n=1 Tax=Drosophila hydei TaxID=7224 RepID=A0A6J1M170_DROHY|nr:uncharacterized protein LOC111599008 [Drosophila hydei]